MCCALAGAVSVVIAAYDETLGTGWRFESLQPTLIETGPNRNSEKSCCCCSCLNALGGTEDRGRRRKPHCAACRHAASAEHSHVVDRRLGPVGGNVRLMDHHRLAG